MKVRAREIIYGIIPLHVMTGCDHTSGFYGIGKKTVADRVSNQLRPEIILHRVV